MKRTSKSKKPKSIKKMTVKDLKTSSGGRATCANEYNTKHPLGKNGGGS